MGTPTERQKKIEGLTAQLAAAKERIVEQDDYIDVIFEQFHAQGIGVIEADERIAELEAGLAEIHGEIGYYLEHDRELLEKIAALK